MSNILEANSRRNQLKIELALKKTEEASKVQQLVELHERHKQSLAKIQELKDLITAYKKDEPYVTAGKLILQDAKHEVRMLSVQCEGQDLNLELLNMQLAAFSEPADLKHLRALADQLKRKRGLIFKSGSINPDPPCETEQVKQYRLGKSIGKKVSPISTH